MLFLVATPIGNLADITLRALETLRSVDLILCEDTRYSQRLLQHYDIATHCQSLHKFNELARIEPLIERLKSHQNIALISDAGTPGIADPGSLLVACCVRENIPVTSIPGPCAAIAALGCSGLPTDLFQFCGFLPRKTGELKKKLLSILAYAGTSCCYESPKRIVDALALLSALEPKRAVVVARELTKMHESLIRGSAEEVYAHFKDKDQKGEFVLLIAGKQNTEEHFELSPEEHVAWLESTYKVSQREAIKIAAAQRGMRKRELYQKMLEQPQA